MAVEKHHKKNLSSTSAWLHKTLDREKIFNSFKFEIAYFTTHFVDAVARLEIELTTCHSLKIY